jgi:hypothetical protein
MKLILYPPRRLPVRLIASLLTFNGLGLYNTIPELLGLSDKLRLSSGPAICRF